MLPLAIEAAEYLPDRTSVAAAAAAAGVRAEAGLRLRLAPRRARTSPTSAPIACRSSSGARRAAPGSSIADPGRHDRRGGEGGRQRASPVILPPPEPYGFDDQCALLPAKGESFRGYRILREYFACPSGSSSSHRGAQARARGGRSDLELVFLFRRSAELLAGAVGPDNFRLFCSPAVNLFEKPLGGSTCASTITSPWSRPTGPSPRLRDLPAARGHGPAQDGAAPRGRAPVCVRGAPLRLERRPVPCDSAAAKAPWTKEQRLRGRNDYGHRDLPEPGRPRQAELLENIREITVRALVTNRELPELLRFSRQPTDPSRKPTDFDAPGVPAERVMVVRPPTRPRPPLGLSGRRLARHRPPDRQYASLVSGPDGDPSLLRDHLGMYGYLDDPAMRRQVDGVRSVASEPVVPS